MRRLNDKFIKKFFDDIPAAIVIKDKSSRAILVNSSACHFYDLSEEKVVGREPESILAPERAKMVRETDGRVLATGKDVEYEDQGIDASGSLRTFVTRKRLTSGPNGEPLIIGVANDITALRETEDHYRYSVSLNPQIPWTANPDGTIDEVGDRAEEITGLSFQQTRGTGWTEAVHPADLDEALAAWQQALTTGDTLDSEYRIRTRDGSYLWSRARAAPRRNRDGQIIRWYGTLEDVHHRKMIERALQDSEERFRLAARAAGLGVWDYDAVEGRRTWTPELRRMFGLLETDPADPNLVRALLHEDDLEQFDDMIRAAADKDLAFKFSATLRIRRANDGRERYVETNGWKVVESGQLKRVVITVRDVTDERQADQRLLWAATHDVLTGLPNRVLFQERLNSAIEVRQPDARVGLLLLDVDDLKLVNDTLGHGAGDELLRLFADRLQDAVRIGDTAARLGGDEFAVILPDIPQDDELVTQMGSRIFARMSEPFLVAGRQIKSQPSIGVSFFPAHGAGPGEILKAADLALYAAKKTARGSLVTFSSEITREERRRSSMIATARQALDDDRIVPFYQPKVDLGTGGIVGFEALLRWCGASGKVEGPASIIAALSDHDVAEDIRVRMFDQVTRDMRQWLDLGIEFGSVAINAGEVEMRSDGLADHILEGLSEASIPPSRMQLEIVESVFVGRGAEYIERTLDALSQEGIAIALDDFGTGYASLTHLNTYPVDVVKIDRSFVQDMESNAGNSAIVGAVVGLGRNLGISVVAEGIERTEQAELLRELGCEIGQGYLFSKAVPAKRVPELLKAQKVRK